MKALLMSFALLAMFAVNADAQQKKTSTAQTLTQSLSQVTTQNGLINLGNLSVNVSNVTVQDVVNVQNVLNNAEISLLNDALNGNNVLNNVSVDLSNLLRNANILNKNQVVVGVLSDQDRIKFVTANANKLQNKK
ncbi:hypothetical protein [Aridibaculum aurantiacum]|uniref:hypothetical protein n=1 Tax=Aridibaculum aurantiacum TaxID=2810307 RepID=UPI001A967D07|nr:hypothetical protein [Aridibaculum aurantiacum]